MIPVIIWGAGGRMGSRLIASIMDGQDFVLAAAIDHSTHHSIGEDSGLFHGFKATGIPILTEPSQSVNGVVIDFSLQGGPARAARWATENRCPIISGTTAFTPSDEAELRTASLSVPVLTSPNFSLGIQLMLQFAAKASHLLPGIFDASLVETHHIHKKDKPSGTALAIGEAIKTNSPMPRHLDVAAIRLSQVTGEHELRFESPFERLVISHTALNRDVFVQGALLAAKWIWDRAPGRYSFADILDVP